MKSHKFPFYSHSIPYKVVTSPLYPYHLPMISHPIFLARLTAPATSDRSCSPRSGRSPEDLIAMVKRWDLLYTHVYTIIYIYICIIYYNVLYICVIYYIIYIYIYNINLTLYNVIYNLINHIHELSLYKDMYHGPKMWCCCGMVIRPIVVIPY